MTFHILHFFRFRRFSGRRSGRAGALVAMEAGVCILNGITDMVACRTVTKRPPLCIDNVDTVAIVG